jgi:hypothetical protein
MEPDACRRQTLPRANSWIQHSISRFRLLERVPFAGTYTVNADGTGTLMIQVPGTPTIPVAIVVTDGGSSLMFVQTGVGNSLLAGTARKQ